MMGTEIFKIDASWAEKLTKTRVQFLLTPTVFSPGGRDPEQLRGGAVPRPPPQQEEQEAGARRQALAVR